MNAYTQAFHLIRKIVNVRESLMRIGEEWRCNAEIESLEAQLFSLPELAVNAARMSYSDKYDRFDGWVSRQRKDDWLELQASNMIRAMYRSRRNR